MIVLQVLNPPPPIKHSGRPPKYPWRTMEIGSSFTVPAAEAPEYHSMKIFCYTKNGILKKRFTPFLNADGSITVTRRS